VILLRIIVLSDTHGAIHRLNHIIKKHMNNADLFLHLGDGAKEWLEISNNYPQLNMKMVSGNCDSTVYKLPHELILNEEGYSIFASHGDLYQVKFGLDNIIQKAKEISASILLYGHTHQSFTNYQDGFYIFNPGSLGRPSNGIPSYGILDLTPNGVVCSIAKEKFL